jgi:hypothetical protein
MSKAPPDLECTLLPDSEPNLGLGHSDLATALRRLIRARSNLEEKFRDLWCPTRTRYAKFSVRIEIV